jgi:hypothetical protein
VSCSVEIERYLSVKYSDFCTYDEIVEKQKLSGEKHLRVSEFCVELSDENLKWVYGGVGLSNMSDTTTDIKNTLDGVILTYL